MMRSRLATISFLLYCGSLNADASSICSSLPIHDLSEWKELTNIYHEVCEALPHEFKGVFVSTAHGLVPVPGVFSIAVSDIRHLYFTVHHERRPAGWDYGALIVMRQERVEEIARDNVEYLHREFTEGLGSKCELEIRMRRYQQSIPGGKHLMTFHELLIGDYSFHLAGKSNMLLRVMAESFAELNC